WQFVLGADRDSKWPEMQNGVLTQISYPTGGFTAFEFEPHTTWVNTTQNTPVFRYSYSVGYDGNTVHDYLNVAFSNNHYQITLSNAAGPRGGSACTAGAYLISSTNQTYSLVTSNGSESNTAVFQVPAGNFTVHLTRSPTQTGTGSEANFREIISTPYQANAMVGGLRVKTITQNDGMSYLNNIVTSYNYDVNGQSTGVLYSRPAYVQIVRNDVVKQFGWSPAGNNTNVNLFPNGCFGVEPVSTQAYFKSPCPIIPMATTQGNHIGYNEVKLSQAGNGYSIYRYYGSNLWENIIDDVAYRNVNPGTCSSSLPNAPAAPLPYEYKRGELKYESHFNQAGQILKDIYYYYTFDSTAVTTPAYMVKYILGAMLGTRYELKGYWKKQIQTVTTDYVPGEGNNSNTSTTYFESVFHHQPTRQETYNSLGNILATKTKYALDLRISDCDAISNCSSPLFSSCSSCDATMYSAMNNCTTISCRYWAWVSNIICRANARKTFINCKRTNFNNPTNAFATCMANAKANADALLKPILELHNEFNNAPIESSSWNNNLLTGASFNQFDFVTNPAGKAYLNKTLQINLASSSGSFTPAETSANNLTVTKDSRYE